MGTADVNVTVKYRNQIATLSLLFKVEKGEGPESVRLELAVRVKVEVSRDLLVPQCVA